MTARDRLDACLRPFRATGVAVAYSGGVDSALLLAALAACRRAGDFPLRALIFHSPLQCVDEADEAVALPRALGVPWRIVEADPLAVVPGLAQNPPDRCYRCKRFLLGCLLRAADGLPLVDGTNADDRRAGDRPGLRALAERGVRSPLAEAGLTKAEVRALARAFALPMADRPASPCLATRVPFGEPLTPARLRRVETAEACVRACLPEVADLRVRDRFPEACLEVPSPVLALSAARRPALEAALAPLGFATLTFAPLHPKSHENPGTACGEAPTC